MDGSFAGRPPGKGAGEMSSRTKRLRPNIGLTDKQISEARTLRRGGMEPDVIAATMGAPLDAVEKALVQMRCARPETTRGTLNVTLKAHSLVNAERVRNEPLWQTFDRMVDELLSWRASAAETRERQGEIPRSSVSQVRSRPQPPLPLLALLDGR